MAQFASADDLAARLGLTLTAGEETRADTLLTLASGVIQNETGQTIALVEDDELTLPGTTDDMILLPERPVVSVASITLDGESLAEGTDWWLDGAAVNRLSSTGRLPSGLIDELTVRGVTSGFGRPDQDLVITYTHGYETIPATVKAICLEIVTRVWVNPGAAARSRVGDTDESYRDVGMTLTDDEKKSLRRIFGRKASSITVGR